EAPDPPSGVGEKSLVEEAAHGVLVADGPQARRASIARARHEAFTAWVKGTARRPVVGVRYGARDRRQALGRAHTHAGDGAQERPRIRMARGVKDRVNGR